MIIDYNTDDFDSINEHPKYRKQQEKIYDPFFTVSESGEIHYFASFKNGEGEVECPEITKEIYDFFVQCGREDTARKREDERHLEQSDLTEATLNRRAVNKPKTVEEMVEERELARNVYRIVGSLPKIQYRRFVLYYQTDTSFEEISKKENCSSSTIRDCINCAKRRFKKFFQK